MALKTHSSTRRTFDAKQQERHKGFYRPTLSHKPVDKSQSQNRPNRCSGSDLKDTCVSIAKYAQRRNLIACKIIFILSYQNNKIIKLQFEICETF